MGKLATAAARRGPSSPMRTTGERIVGHEGSPAWRPEAKTELFTLAATNMVSEQTFYETAADRDARFAALVREVAVGDPGWISRFAPYLRGTLNMRTASVVLAVETVLAWRDHATELPEGVSVRRLVDSVCQRADEPGELISYWRQASGRRSVPGGVQRGLADAVTRLLDERSAIKWDGQGKAWRLGDVIEVVHPTPRGPWQHELFNWLLDRRRHADAAESLSEDNTVMAYERLRAMPPDEQRGFLIGDPQQLRAAGVTWEHLAGLGPMDKAAWEAVIPSMGYMALLRNLRNFDEARVSDVIAATVGARLSDPERVATSRQLPFRFLSAYKAAPSPRWAWPLAQALEHSVSNVPRLPGRTLVCIDTSASMNGVLSARSTVRRVDAATVLAFALAGTCETVDVMGFATGYFAFAHDPAKGVLKQSEEFSRLVGTVGHGTNMASAVRWGFNRDHRGAGMTRHDRVVIVTDDQPHDGDPGREVPATTPLFVVDVGGYGRSSGPRGVAHRHLLGGLSDATFTMIDVLGRGYDAEWPF